ncbi:outer membrane protein [Xanthobacteraceae bacterium A53D]
MRLASALVASLALSATAQASDFDFPALGRPGDFSLEAPEVEEDATESGWYIRTIVGGSGVRGSINGLRRGNVEEPTSRVYGVGAGYRFAPWLRGDLTVDHAAAISIQRPAGTAHFTASTAMANVYWDMITIGNLTPYVGAGAGFGITRFRFSPLFGTAGWGESDVNFAWNATAGVGWAVTSNWTVDVNYRYVALGSPSFAMPGTGVPFTVEGAEAHQVRLGVRYTFN